MLYTDVTWCAYPNTDVTWCAYPNTDVTWCAYPNTDVTWCAYPNTDVTWCAYPNTDVTWCAYPNTDVTWCAYPNTDVTWCAYPNTCLTLFHAFWVSSMCKGGLQYTVQCVGCASSMMKTCINYACNFPQQSRELGSLKLRSYISQGHRNTQTSEGARRF